MSILIFMRVLAACIATGGAVFLAYYDKPGWGWFIFLAIILGSVTMTECK